MLTVNTAGESVISDGDLRSAYRRALTVEAIISALINIIMGGLVAWAHFGGDSLVPIWGYDGIVTDMVPSTFAPVFIMALILSAVLQRRRALGAFAIARQAVTPPFLSVVPRGIVRRVIALAAIATLLSLAISASILALSGATTMSFQTFWLLKAAHNGAVGLICGAIITACALAEPVEPGTMVARTDASAGKSGHLDHRRT